VVLHLWAQDLEEGDEHPPTLPCGAWLTLPLPLIPFHGVDMLICKAQDQIWPALSLTEPNQSWSDSVALTAKPQTHFLTSPLTHTTQ